MVISEFRDIYAAAVKFYNLVTREPRERREDFNRVNKLVIELGKLKDKFSALQEEVQPQAIEDPVLKQSFLDFIKDINSYLNKTQEILSDRQKSLDRDTQKGNSDCKIQVTMSEKFDLRTAASLLPSTDGNEEATKQLIDAIELYSELIDENGKSLLIKYVLKTKLTQNAKLRLDSAYNSVDNLLRDMKKCLLSQKSPAILSNQLHCVKQDGKTIDEYAKKVETLLFDLTTAQAENDATALGVLRKINEKIAINAFTNGLRNNELKTIVKARDYKCLKDAVTGAKEEELNVGPYTGNKVFHIKGTRNFNKTHFSQKPRGSFHFSQNPRGRPNGNIGQHRGYNNNNNNNHGRNYVNGNVNKNLNQRSNQGRGRQFNSGQSRSIYFADHSRNVDDLRVNDRRQFFRDSPR